MSSGYVFINSYTLSQCDDSSAFKEMDGDSKKSDFSSRYGSMNIHTVYQYNFLKSLINYNNRDDMDMNANLYNEYMSSGTDLLKRYTLPQYNKSSNLNDMNMGVENGDVNGGYCYMNSSTGSKSKNRNFVVSTKKMKLLPKYLKWKIMDYRMGLALMLCYLYPHLINIPTWNATINIITFYRI